MTDRPSLTRPFALLARWRASTPADPALPVEPRQPVTVPAAAEESLRPEEHLVAIADAAEGVVPEETLTIFLAPIRAALATPPAERDPAALAADLDRLEDLLEAFFLRARPQPSEVPP